MFPYLLRHGQLMHVSSTAALVVFGPFQVSAAQETFWYFAYGLPLWIIVAIIRETIKVPRSPAKNSRMVEAFVSRDDHPTGKGAPFYNAISTPSLKVHNLGVSRTRNDWKQSGRTQCSNSCDEIT